jgi:hypothetical protein
MAAPARLGPGNPLAAPGGDPPPGWAAEVYAACGIPVLPLYEPGPDGGCACPAGPACGDVGKHPRVTGGTHAASTDPRQVRRWWRRWPRANLAARTGVEFDVCDVDGPAGVAALRAVFHHAGYAHCGPVARSGGGGWHLLFAPTGLGNRVGLLPGVDWRGQAGIIVLPPSQHRSGRPYTWARPLTAALPEVPAGLGRLLAPPPRPATRPPGVLPTGRAGAWARGALQAEQAAVATARPGTCNATLNRAAFRLGQLVVAGLLEADQVRVMLLAAAVEAGNPERKARATIESGLAGAARKPRATLPTGGGDAA